MHSREVTANGPEPERRTLRIEIAPRTMLWMLGVIATVWLAFQLSVVLIVITVALVIVGTLDPLVAWFERHNIRRGRALALIFFAIALLIAGLLMLTVPPLVTQLLHASSQMRRRAGINWCRSGCASTSWPGRSLQSISAVPLNNLATRAGDALVGYSPYIMEMIGYAISTAFLSIYLLADPIRAKGLLFAVVPRNGYVKLARILLELKVIVGGYMRGQLITSVAIAVFTLGLLSVFRVEDALALALFAGVTDIIPFIGGYVASIPVIVAVSGSGVGAMIIVA